MTKTERLMERIPDEYTCALITDPVNRRFFTGFKSSDGTVLCFKEKAYFIVDFRYYEKAAETVKDMEVILQDDLTNQIAELFVRHCTESVMIEADTMTVTGLREFSEEFEDDIYIDSSPELSEIITDLRIIKSDEDMENIIAAQRIAEEAYQYILENIRKGMTEKEVALMLDSRMKLLGAEDISFETIVLFGKNTSLPHGVPGDTKLESGFVLMDFGAVINGWHSDMTRTFYVGTPSEREKSAYETVLKAQLAALDAVKPDMQASALDRVARDIIDASEFKGAFGHSLGHGVGLEIHEAPAVSRKSTDYLDPGMVITVEPGIYLPGEFGIRTEDMGVMTEDGFRNITEAPKELRIIF